MRRNHAHDRDLLDKIERREPTGFEVVDDLRTTVPRADPRFQDELEARLMIRMQSRGVKDEREEDLMQTSVVLPKTERLPRSVFKPSLTLIAAILAMVLVGAALLLINNGSQPDTELGAGLPAQDDTATPTPTHTHTPGSTLPLNPAQVTGTAIIVGATGTAAAIEALGTPTYPFTTATPIPFGTQATLTQDELRETSMAIEATLYASTLTQMPSLATPTPVPDFTLLPPMVDPHADSIPAEAVIGVPAPSLRIVVITSRDLPKGTMITKEDVILTYWPADVVPAGSYDGIVYLVGNNITRDVSRWQPIVIEDLTFTN